MKHVIAETTLFNDGYTMGKEKKYSITNK